MKLSDLAIGKIVVTDNGFTCISRGEHVVQGDANGDLFIACSDGKHMLCGQVDENGDLIGLSIPETHPILAHLTRTEIDFMGDLFSIAVDDVDENGALAIKLSLIVKGIQDDLDKGEARNAD